MDIQRRDFLQRISKSSVVFGLSALWASRSPGIWEAQTTSGPSGLVTPFKAARTSMSQWGQYGVFIPIPKTQGARKALGDQLAALLTNPDFHVKSALTQAVYVCAPVELLGDGAKVAFGSQGDPESHKFNVALMDQKGRVIAGHKIDWSHAKKASQGLHNLLWSKSVQGPRLTACRDAEVEQWLKQAEVRSTKVRDPKKPMTTEERVAENDFWSKFHLWLRADGRRACPTAAAWLQRHEAREINNGFTWRLRSVMETSFDTAFYGKNKGTLPYGLKMGEKHQVIDRPSCPACGMFAAPPPTRVFLDFLTQK